MSTDNKPIHEIRLGAMKATLWQNETVNGPRCNVTLRRLYKDAEDKWQDSDSFGRDDLLPAQRVLDLAYLWIHEQGL